MVCEYRVAQMKFSKIICTKKDVGVRMVRVNLKQVPPARQHVCNRFTLRIVRGAEMVWVWGGVFITEWDVPA